MLVCLFAQLKRLVVGCVLLWPKFLDTKKSELAVEQTFVIGEDIMRAHLTVS